MQKDIHYYFTQEYLIECGFDRTTAHIISMMDQLVDLEVRTTDLKLVLTNLKSIALHHFIHPHNSIICTAGNDIITNMLYNYFITDIFMFGIFLHTYQDSFSHQGFAGYQHNVNSVYPWYHPMSLLPNIGHAELLALPDIANGSWTDYRTEDNDIIQNKIRVQDMVTKLDEILSEINGCDLDNSAFLDKFLSFHKYEDRKQFCMRLGTKRFSNALPSFRRRYKDEIKRAFTMSELILKAQYYDINTLIIKNGGEYRAEKLKGVKDEKDNPRNCNNY